MLAYPYVLFNRPALVAHRANPAHLLRLLAPCTKRHSFLSFPYVCPEPVLVKCSFLYINGSKSAVFRTHHPRKLHLLLLNLADALALWTYEWLPVPASPHIEVLYAAKPKTVRAFLAAPYFKLPPADIAALEADAAKCQRYQDLVTHTWLPPLQVILELLTRQVGHPLASCSLDPRCELQAADNTRAVYAADAPQAQRAPGDP